MEPISIKKVGRLLSINTAFIAALLSFPNPGFSVSLPWFTTYNCPDWLQYADSLNCDGLAKKGSWTCNGQAVEIVTAGNYSGGGGGKGQRHYEGDGVNVNSGSTSLSFDTKQPELWIRWYMRYPSGYNWSSLSYDKWIYIDQGLSTYVVPEWYGSSANIYVSGHGNIQSGSSYGWSGIMGGSTGDGQFHSYEVHLKMDTNGSNGIAQMWIDDIQVIDNTTVNFGNHAGWSFMLIGSNQKTPSNGKCLPVDFDDIAVSNTGRIGSFNAAPPPPQTPQSPIGFQAN